MRFLVDENLPHRLCVWLRAKGHDADHVLQAELRGAADSDIWREAARRGACIVTRDNDFLMLAAGDGRCCVVHLTIGNCSTKALLAWLDECWVQAEAELAMGIAVVTL